MRKALKISPDLDLKAEKGGSHASKALDGSWHYFLAGLRARGRWDPGLIEEFKTAGGGPEALRGSWLEASCACTS